MKLSNIVTTIAIIFVIILSTLLLIIFLKPKNVDNILSSMSNEEKIAQMLMPSFRKQKDVEINYDNIKDIISTYNFAGVILFAENTPDVESTMRFIDLLQSANKNHKSRLLIGIDQEGGYVARLVVSTTMPGNMALAATNNSNYAYDAAKIIGKELKVLGINTNFAPVVDVNSNPSNPVIGVRSFSDDANVVATYSEKFMKGLQSEGIITSLKHFPGHGDTSTDTHTNLAIVNKTYNELKNNELIPFQKLINSNVEMIMTAHIQFPNIEKDTYTSISDSNTYTLPATLSKTILTDILRKDMKYKGIIVSDALDMDAISKNFDLVDASIKAINAGADILLMPFTYDSQKDELKDYIKTLASKVGSEISEERVNESVLRILKLKEDKGLLQPYDNSNLEANILKAKQNVSSKENHDEEFEIAKKAITMVKNDDNILPLNSNDKTLILYEYDSHVKSINNALSLLIDNKIIENKDNINTYPIYKDNKINLDNILKKAEKYKNIIIIHSLYSSEDLNDPDLNKMNKIIDYAHKNKSRVIVLSTQLPYDVAKLNKADAILLTYLANGIKFNISEYDKELPKYGPNIIAGIYMLYSNKENLNGVLPVNIYNIDDDNKFTNEILYKRGYGLKYTNINY